MAHSPQLGSDEDVSREMADNPAPAPLSRQELLEQIRAIERKTITIPGLFFVTLTSIISFLFRTTVPRGLLRLCISSIVMVGGFITVIGLLVLVLRYSTDLTMFKELAPAATEEEQMLREIHIEQGLRCGMISSIVFSIAIGSVFCLVWFATLSFEWMGSRI